MAARRLPGPRSFRLQVPSTRLSPAQPQPAAVSVWRCVSRVPSGVLRRPLACDRIRCATYNRFAQRLPIRGTRPPRSCLHREGDLLGQVSGQSVPVCGAFVEYSSYDPSSPKTSGLWTHITTGPKKWGQATQLCYLCSIRSLPFTRKDRKSTRLNSSHVSISYAVFCLKKKKQPQTP